ncbi:S8 family serine peptidase [Vogesella sp. LIG4]|uniref:S53 family peptidase n=1 Tax=Vogesella sp. LIG4 TaxID=1192162 RepID=UPI00081F80E1|nr:S8 family serine peptidase [Vogesella sp. LIG4]SCK22606.1 Predicted protease [Vogesella sp. LIG4]
MNNFILMALHFARAILVVSLFGSAGLAAAQNAMILPKAGVAYYHIPVCPGPANAGTVRCHAHVLTDIKGVPQATKAGGSGTPVLPSSGFGSPQFQGAYGLSGLSGSPGSGMTVAIVDAYDNPRAEQDLAYYSTAWGLPSCTTANGCFRKVNQNGGTNYPRANAGWALEIALDVQTVHAVCPNCRILLVEASSSSISNLLAAENYAAAHANVVSNSWGSSEFSGEASYDTYFGRVLTTVSSGDSGYGAQWPAASRNVIAVGGTTLMLSVTGSSYTRYSEAVWSGSGSGCSKYLPQSVWQSNYFLIHGNPSPSCNNRVIADVAADADPGTGAAVYDSYGYNGQSGWFVVGGTSLASPIIAAIYAMAGNGLDTASIYRNVNYGSTIYDVKSGSNSNSGCSDNLCSGLPGFDGPSGLGTPIGVGAFTP